MNYGLQMYSVRDLTPTDMEKALCEISKMGYTSVEFAGFFGHDAKEIKGLLDKYHLTCIATHTGAEGLMEDAIAGQIAFLQTIGCTRYVIPGADLSTKAKLDSFIELVNRAQPVLEQNGMLLGFHNHYTEFLPNQDGLYVHHELENRTNIHFEIDTYWAYYAKQDPIALLERLKDRVFLIHLKDGIEQDCHALGEGNAPVPAIRRKAMELGIPMIVESESMQPDGLSEVKRCIEYLRRNGGNSRQFNYRDESRTVC